MIAGDVGRVHLCQPAWVDCFRQASGNGATGVAELEVFCCNRSGILDLGVESPDVGEILLGRVQQNRAPYEEEEGQDGSRILHDGWKSDIEHEEAGRAEKRP